MRPVAGEEMASRCVLVIRGGRKPFVVEVKSKTEVPAGLLVPIPKAVALSFQKKLLLFCASPDDPWNMTEPVEKPGLMFPPLNVNEPPTLKLFTEVEPETPKSPEISA